MLLAWDLSGNLESNSTPIILKLSETVTVSLPILCEIRLPSTRLIGTSILHRNQWLSMFILSHHLVHHWKNFRTAVLVRPSISTLVSALIKRLPSSAKLNFSDSIQESDRQEVRELHPVVLRCWF